MTMTVSVLRGVQDRTNGGVSRRNDGLLVVLPGQVPPEDATAPVMVLERWGQGARMRPLVAPRDFSGQVGPMDGGNRAVGGPDFAAAVCRFLGRPFDGAVPIHDRYESQELHDQLAELCGRGEVAELGG